MTHRCCLVAVVLKWLSSTYRKSLPSYTTAVGAANHVPAPLPVGGTLVPHTVVVTLENVQLAAPKVRLPDSTVTAELLVASSAEREKKKAGRAVKHGEKKNAQNK